MQSKKLFWSVCSRIMLHSSAIDHRLPLELVWPPEGRPGHRQAGRDPPLPSLTLTGGGLAVRFLGGPAPPVDSV